MPLGLPFRSQKIALGAVGLAGAALLSLTLPTRGQQPAPGQPGTPTGEPVFQITAPAAASGVDTLVRYALPLPTTWKLNWRARIVVYDTAGNLLAVVPMVTTQREPTVAGFARLHTSEWPAGTYRIGIQADLDLPDGTRRTVTSPTVALTVPESSPAPTPSQ